MIVPDTNNARGTKPWHTNGLEPWAYLNYLFDRLPTAKTPVDIHALLPHTLKNDDLKL